MFRLKFTTCTKIGNLWTRKTRKNLWTRKTYGPKKKLVTYGPEYDT